MTSPHHLHAVAAAWSLQAARTALAQLARAANRRAADDLLAAASILRAPVYGTRLSGGGHGDPTTGVLLAPPTAHETTWADLLQRSTGRLDWLADAIRCPTGLTVGRIREHIPALPPGTVRLVARHLADEDAWVRAAIRQPRPVEPLTGVPCPHCGERQLVVQTAGPVDAWTVICTTGRLCTGAGCPCGMPGAVEGVAHIWRRADVLGAVAGAVPANTEAG
ncbi:hypothetical protein [Micromonospora sp. NPDC023633]|uniref:hypothetical protein n=1 Tax=Micromonospora sp. NPDC023633 TaxID=3154320 RepID=UPI003408EAD0